jgi:hypothetical protein
MQKILAQTLDEVRLLRTRRRIQRRVGGRHPRIAIFRRVNTIANTKARGCTVRQTGSKPSLSVNYGNQLIRPGKPVRQCNAFRQKAMLKYRR